MFDTTFHNWEIDSESVHISITLLIPLQRIKTITSQSVSCYYALYVEK